MSDTLWVLLVVWTMGTMALGAVSVIRVTELGDWEPERRHFARMVLTCWAWPIWAVRFAARSIRQLIAIATQETR